MTPELQKLRDAVARVRKMLKGDPGCLALGLIGAIACESACVIGPRFCRVRRLRHALARLRLKQRRLAYERLVEAEAWADEERMHETFVRWHYSRGWLLAWADWTVRKAVSRATALARSIERMEAKARAEGLDWPDNHARQRVGREKGMVT